MSLLACGLNHKTAPLSLRERIVFTPEILPQPLLELVEKVGVKEAAILSTCNRTELYCIGGESNDIISWLHKHRHLPNETLKPFLYLHHDQSAVQHMLRVASGIDSMVIGEPQILGQLKTAYAQAHQTGTVGKHLRHLFQYVFSASKKIRTTTEIGAHSLSIAATVIELAKHIFANLEQLNVLCVGAGDTIESVIRTLKNAGFKHLIIANRSAGRVEKLIRRNRLEDVQTISLEEITNILSEVDIVITATNSLLPLVGKGAVERAIKIRKRRILLLFDLAVPRNIEPEVAHLSDAYLYTLDNLQDVIQQNLQHRQTAANEAETLIENYTNQYMTSLKVLDAGPHIHSYRQQAEEVRDKELGMALYELEKGIKSPQEVIKRFAHRLTNKLLHNSTCQLREMAEKK